MEQAGRSGAGLGARLLVAFVLILAGASAAVWGLAHYQGAARALGVVRAVAPVRLQPAPGVDPASADPKRSMAAPNPAVGDQIAQLQQRVGKVESENQQAQGSAGRADALLIAFAARRSIDRGVALGYLEPLLAERFGSHHPQAVATIITGARSPVRLTQLIDQYQDLDSRLTGPPQNESLWTGVKRGLSSLITVHDSARPSSQPQARFDRALAFLTAGEVDSALAETMRLPGAARANQWIASARRYVAVQRSLDEIESAALIGDSVSP